MNVSRCFALCSVAAAMACHTGVADAKNKARVLRSPKEMYQVLAAIPARGDILGRVMFHLGMEAAHITISDTTPDDNRNSGVQMRKGDKIIDIYLQRPPPANAGCPILQPISFIQRNGAYLPESRASNFLLTGVCALPR